MLTVTLVWHKKKIMERNAVAAGVLKRTTTQAPRRLLPQGAMDTGVSTMHDVNWLPQTNYPMHNVIQAHPGYHCTVAQTLHELNEIDSSLGRRLDLEKHSVQFLACEVTRAQNPNVPARLWRLVCWKTVHLSCVSTGEQIALSSIDTTGGASIAKLQIWVMELPARTHYSASMQGRVSVYTPEHFVEAHLVHP